MPGMDTSNLRRSNLRKLMDEHGVGTLAHRLGYKGPSFLSQMAGPHPSREVTEHTAREVERLLGLPIGWMDQEHTGPSPTHPDVVAAAVRMVGELAREEHCQPPPEKLADLVALALDDLHCHGRLRRDHVRRLVRLCTRVHH